MKFICSLLVVCTLLSLSVAAQQNHFLFIQTENRQPFNITLNSKVYSSTATGYVIIPKLQSGQYNIVAGFGGNTIADQNFTINIEQKDVGFSLKNNSGKAWELFNLQTYQVTPSQQSVAGNGNNNSVASKVVVAKETNKPAEKIFQPEVSQVSKTEPVLSSPTLQSPKKTMQPAEPTVSKTGDLNVNVSPNNTAASSYKASPRKSPAAVPVSQSTIIKISELKGAEAYYITYIDVSGNNADTINILIPNAKIQALKNNEPQNSQNLRFLNIETKTGTMDEKVEGSNNNNPVSQTKPETFKSTVFAKCSTLATNDDFLKLRKKMAASADNDGMLTEAKRTFKNLCFTTVQVKNLAYLFLNDAARYQFFDAAYPFISDADQFPTLSIMLSDNYYINRFKAMLIN